MVRGKSVCLFFATKLQKIPFMGKRLVIFMKSSEFSFPSACIYLRCPSRIPLLRASYTVAVPSPPGCPKTYQLLSFCHGERSRAISLNLQERVLRSLDCAPLDRMIMSEEFSDNPPVFFPTESDGTLCLCVSVFDTN